MTKDHAYLYLSSISEDQTAKRGSSLAGKPLGEHRL